MAAELNNKCILASSTFFGSLKEKHDLWCIVKKKKSFIRLQGTKTFLKWYKFILIKNDCTPEKRNKIRKDFGKFLNFVEHI